MKKIIILTMLLAFVSASFGQQINSKTTLERVGLL